MINLHADFRVRVIMIEFGSRFGGWSGGDLGVVRWGFGGDGILAIIFDPDNCMNINALTRYDPGRYAWRNRGLPKKIPL